MRRFPRRSVRDGVVTRDGHGHRGRRRELLAEDGGEGHLRVRETREPD